MSEYLITTEGLTKTFKHVKAVDSVSLHIKEGSIYGLIGRNGAGKTTIMRMIAGLASPDRGRINYDGFEGGEGEAFSKIGSLIETPAIIPSLNAYDNMKIKCLSCGIKDRKYITEKLALVGLDRTKIKAGKFSLGMKQRLGIAMALVGDPKFLILDEPINGLDPQGIAEVRKLLIKLNKDSGITILISSHILSELSKLATDYAIIDRGRILEESTSDELQRRCRDKIVVKTPDGEKIAEILTEKGYSDFKLNEDNTVYVYERLGDIAQLNRDLVMGDVSVESISVVATDLEEYFFKVTGGEGR